MAQFSQTPSSVRIHPQAIVQLEISYNYDPSPQICFNPTNIPQPKKEKPYYLVNKRSLLSRFTGESEDIQ